MEEMLFAGNNLEKTQLIFERFIKRRPRSRLTIRQRTWVLREWPRTNVRPLSLTKVSAAHADCGVLD